MLNFVFRPPLTLWCRGPARHPFKVEIEGSNPSRVATLQQLTAVGLVPWVQSGSHLGLEPGDTPPRHVGRDGLLGEFLMALRESPGADFRVGPIVRAFRVV